VFNPGGVGYFFFGLNQAGPGANSSYCAVGTGPFTWSGPDMVLTTHPHLAPTFRLDKAIPLLSLSLCAFVACYREKFTLTSINMSI